jgi:DNA-binding NarL/FixJ family response regulator
VLNNEEPAVTRKIGVAVVEDQLVIREGLKLLLNTAEGYRCTGCFRSVEDALARLGDDLPDIVLMDIGLPGMSGIEGIANLRQRWRDMLVIMLTVYEDDDKIFEALCAGASGYLLKRTPPERLIESLKEVLDGGAPMSPEVARRVISVFKHFHPPAKSELGLTPHEIRLLKMLVDGHSYKTAASDLGSSINTIGTHMRNIYRKLEVHSKSEAVSKALRSGLV